ncbi:N-acetyltransferase 9-like protein isoform X2 [Diabrotica virgifera virgifera]|uniref:N-acetyltransferase domain-containing protein n=1 Tax=Diabrotica virgifera virgifera TaxID=50390 RepID=A0ABM5K3I3_DIAVI|nr:N-acetyltransferase 9-like protein isoform X2 [Diabrotica virgifera virgifera]
MLINKDTTIQCQRVILIPYRKEHVLKYHLWMKSENLQHLTGSEPLTLEEEYEMQKSWLMDENNSMIGDTNLFFANADDRICAEAEIMIAEEWARGRKCGWEAMLLMFMYGIQYLGVKQYIVKILYDNDVSIKMFQEMGFVEVSRSEVFKEVTYSKLVDELWITWMKNNLGHFIVVDKNAKNDFDE